MFAAMLFAASVGQVQYQTTYTYHQPQAVVTYHQPVTVTRTRTRTRHYRYHAPMAVPATQVMAVPTAPVMAVPVMRGEGCGCGSPGCTCGGAESTRVYHRAR